jgi:glycosyltransferase involved in cell wall biosynthesis
MARKVLIISYVWPPAEGVGMLRASRFAKYLPSYGWEPLVLTVDPGTGNIPAGPDGLDGIRVFRTGYTDVIGRAKSLITSCSAPAEGRGDRAERVERGPAAAAGHGKNVAASLLREMIAMPDEQRGWFDFAVAEGKKIVDRERPDAVFSTSPPETAHLIGRALKRYGRIPWVADLRDLWADDHFRQRPAFKRAILRRMERANLRDADAVVTVSWPWALSLRESLGRDSVEVIENGYDEQDFEGLRYRGNGKFTIVYTGKLHREHQPVEVLFAALEDLIARGLVDRARVEADFYVFGYDRPDIMSLAKAHGLGDIVRCPGRVGYRESLAAQRSADALIFVQWTGRGGDGWYSAKLYDYIGARRPIVAIAQRGGIVSDLVGKTSSGIVADGVYALGQTILEMYRQYERDGSVRYEGDEDQIKRHTRSCRAAALAGLLDSLVSGGRA